MVDELAAEWAAPESLVLWDKNPRKNARTVGKIVRSIRAFGFGQPLVARRSDRVVVAGNTRLLAAREMRLERVPVRFIDLTDKQLEAYAVADNKIQESSTWDEIKLEELTVGWDASIRDIVGIKLSEKIFEEIEPEGDLSGEPVSKLGEVYQLGPHTLHCDDSTTVDWGSECDFLLTDPPYGVNYVGNDKNKMKIQNDGAEAFGVITKALASSALKDGAFAIVFFADSKWIEFEAAAVASGLTKNQALYWVKNMFSNSRNLYRSQSESFLLMSKGKPSEDRWNGGRTQSTCFFFDRPSRNNEHPTAKPTDLLVRLILNHTKPGDLVRDCFGGGGSTLVAAAQSGRTASLCELDPKYCDAIRRRWARYAQAHDEDIGDGIV